MLVVPINSETTMPIPEPELNALPIPDAPLPNPDRKSYTQCALQNGPRGQIAFIPTKLALLNASLQIKNAQGVWEGGWVVTHVYRTMPMIDIDSIRSAEKLFESKLK